MAITAANSWMQLRNGKMKVEHKSAWSRVRTMAMKLKLPRVEETTSWGEPALKAHGKLWVWWSPNEDAIVFKVPLEDREILVEAEPDTFFFTLHYNNYPMVLMRPDKIDIDWAQNNLVQVWRAQAPKSVLKKYDAGATISEK
jgi:hypothetical protein